MYERQVDIRMIELAVVIIRTGSMVNVIQSYEILEA
jgi:hypothetical protein